MSDDQLNQIFIAQEKVDEEFKNEVNRVRQSFGSMKRGGYKPKDDEQNLEHNFSKNLSFSNKSERENSQNFRIALLYWPLKAQAPN